MNRRQFISLTAGATVFGADKVLRAAPATSPVSFFLVGDTHYCADDGEATAMKAVSLQTNQSLVDWLNRLPGTDFPSDLGGGKVPDPAGVIHAGDLIDTGDKPRTTQVDRRVQTELSHFLADWGLHGSDGKLRWPVREIHGNHDSPGGDGPVISEIKARNKRRKGLTGISPNGLHYSWDWGPVHCVALGITVGTGADTSAQRRYAPMDSLPFLQDDLAKNVGKSGRPVILVHHVDVVRYSKEDGTKKGSSKGLAVEWDTAEVHKFFAALADYRIAGILYGHTHTRNLFRWVGTPDTKSPTGIPTINTDNAGHYNMKQQALTHLTLDDKELIVREFASPDRWVTGAWTPKVWRFPLA